MTGHVRPVMVVLMRLGPVSVGVLVPMVAVVRRLVSVVVAGVCAAIIVRMAFAVFVMCAVVLGDRARLFQEALRIGAEPGPAACRAEPVGLAAVLEAVRAVRRDGHAADRVDVRHDQKSERPNTAISSSTTVGNSLSSRRAASATQWSRCRLSTLRPSELRAARTADTWVRMSMQ